MTAKGRFARAVAAVNDWSGNTVIGRSATSIAICLL